jgi:hypothetical protein
VSKPSAWLILLALACGAKSSAPPEFALDAATGNADTAASVDAGAADLALGADTALPADAPIPRDSAADRGPDAAAPDAALDAGTADTPAMVCGPDTARPLFKAYRVAATGEMKYLGRRPYIGMVGSSPRLLITTYPTLHLLEPDTLTDLEAGWKDTRLDTSPGTWGREGLGLFVGSGGASKALCWDLVGSDIKRLFSIEWGGHTGDAAMVEPLNATGQGLYAAFAVDAQGRSHAAYLGNDSTARHGQRDPSGWVHETAGPAVGQLNGMAMAAAADGRVAIAHLGGSHLSVMVRTGSTWSVERVADGPADNPRSPALVFDQRDALHLLWIDTTKGVLWSVRDPGGWRKPVELTPGFSAPFGYPGGQISMAVAPDGRIHAIAALDVFLQYLRYDGCQWSAGQLEVPKTPGRPPELELPSNFARSPSLAVDDAGRPHLTAVYFPSALSNDNAVYYYLRPLDAPAP